MDDNESSIDFVIKSFRDIDLINGGYYGVCAKLVIDIIDKTDDSVIQEDFVTHNQYSLQPVIDEEIFEYYYGDEEDFDEEHQLTDEMIADYFQILLEEAYEDPKDILAGGGYIPYDGNYHKDLDVMDEIEEYLAPDEDDDQPVNDYAAEDDEIAAILRKQISQIEEYSHFSDAAIELGSTNKAGDKFYYVSLDSGEDMAVKVGHDGYIYWDWNGQILDDDNEAASSMTELEMIDLFVGISKKYIPNLDDVGLEYDLRQLGIDKSGPICSDGHLLDLFKEATYNELEENELYQTIEKICSEYCNKPKQKPHDV